MEKSEEGEEERRGKQVNWKKKEKEVESESFSQIGRRRRGKRERKAGGLVKEKQGGEGELRRTRGSGR